MDRLFRSAKSAKSAVKTHMKTFQERSMLVRFSGGIGFSSRKKDKKVAKEVARSKGTADEDIDVLKRLLPKGSLDAWENAINAARDAHEEATRPWKDDGYRILKSENFTSYTDMMRKHRALCEAQRDQFAQLYPSYCESAPGRLNGLYDPKDFKPIETLLKKFKFKLDWLPVAVGDDFRCDIANDQMAEELATIKRQLDSESRAAALRPFLDPSARREERLSDPDAVFRDTLVSNITEMLRLTPEGDPDLDVLITRIKDLVRHDPQVLRESPSTRQATAAKANEILASMSGYLGAADTPAAPPLELPAPEPETETILPNFDQVANVTLQLDGETAKFVPLPLPMPTPPPPAPLAPGAPASPPAPAIPAWRHALRCTTKTLL
ncbi:hypothetical protein CCP3SC15_1390004 [Gammaproteobacteria bacterium]